jgi:hypothetical protein
MIFNRTDTRWGHMSVVVKLEWRFSPDDYFEETIQFSGEEYTMIIVDGKAR